MLFLLYKRVLKALFHSSQKPTRKLAARTFIQSQYLTGLAATFRVPFCAEWKGDFRSWSSLFHQKFYYIWKSVNFDPWSRWGFLIAASRQANSYTNLNEVTWVYMRSQSRFFHLVGNDLRYIHWLLVSGKHRCTHSTLFKRTLELLISTDVLVRLVCFGMFNGTDLINMDVLLPVRMGKKTWNIMKILLSV